MSLTTIDLSTSYAADAMAAQDLISAGKLDSDHIAIESWINELLIPHLSGIIRDDGTLVDAVVRLRNLHPEVSQALGITPGITGSGTPGRVASWDSELGLTDTGLHAAFVNGTLTIFKGSGDHLWEVPARNDVFVGQSQMNPAGVGLDGLAVSGINGALTLAKVGTTPRTITVPDASGTVALIDTAQTWTAGQSFHAATTPLKAWVEGVYNTGNSTIGDLEEIGRLGDGRGANGSHRLSFFRRRGPGPGGGTSWELTQLGIGRIVDSTWFGSIRFGSDNAHDHIVAYCGAFGVGVEPAVSAGRIQLPIGTTIADGARYGDIHQYRAGAHLMRFAYNDPSAQVEVANNGAGGGFSGFRALHAAPGLETANVVMYGLASATGTEAAGFGTDSNHGLAIRTNGQARIRVGALGELHFAGQTPIAIPTVTGSRGGNAALTSLLTSLANLGLITNGTTA